MATRKKAADPVVEEEVEVKPAKVANEKYFPPCHDSILTIERGLVTVGETKVSKDAIDKIAEVNGMDAKSPFTKARLLHLLKNGKLLKA